MHTHTRARVCTHITCRDTLIWYRPIGYQFIGKYLLISASVVLLLINIANSEFHMNIVKLLSCVGHFPLSLLQYENVQDKIAHS